MTKTTAKNDVRKIQTVLENYIGKRKSAKVAAEISVVMQSETQHNHNGETFFVHKDENGAFVITKESIVSKLVKSILKTYLEEDEIQECMGLLRLDQTLIETNISKKSSKFETLHIEGSDSEIYLRLLRHKPELEITYNVRFSEVGYWSGEKLFQDYLKKAIDASIADFEVFVCDPSIDENGKLQFLPGFKPAVGYSYNELKKLAEENNLRLGSCEEYTLFLGTLIINLIDEGWPESDAWNAICNNSMAIGHFIDSVHSKSEFELTGSRRFGGVCDIGNTSKVLKDGNITCDTFSHEAVLVLFEEGRMDIEKEGDDSLDFSVGWFVR